MPENKSKQKVLILGGGFGGIKAALELADEPAHDVTLISDEDSFRFYPTLYLAALGGKKFASMIPLAEIFEGKDVRIVKDKVKAIKRDKKSISCTSGKNYTYDSLIIGLGVVTNFFGIKGLEKYAYGIKTLEEGHRLRDHIHQQLADEQKPDINYVVIGGGTTGVELAGALPSYIHKVMENHGLADRQIRVDLVEAMPRLLPSMPRDFSKAVASRLRKIGVTIYLKHKVEAETAQELMVNGQPIVSQTVVWTAGVTNHPFFKASNFSLTDRGRVIVDDWLRAEDNIYVIGDNADTPYSGLAQTALYDGKFVADNLKRLSSGKRPRSYKPKKPIYVVPAGPGWAAVLWGKVYIYGWLGWVMRSLADLRGFKEYEPWWQASKRWMATNDTEESCPLCIDK